VVVPPQALVLSCYRIRMFADWFNRVWKIHPHAITDGAGDAAEHAAAMRRAVDMFEALLSGRDYLFGDFGLADVTAFPFLKYASLGQHADDTDDFHAVLAEHMSLVPGSPAPPLDRADRRSPP
jgi:glutathione S-transferase